MLGRAGAGGEGASVADECCLLAVDAGVSRDEQHRTYDTSCFSDCDTCVLCPQANDYAPGAVARGYFTCVRSRAAHRATCIFASDVASAGGPPKRTAALSARTFRVEAIAEWFRMHLSAAGREEMRPGVGEGGCIWAYRILHYIILYYVML